MTTLLSKATHILAGLAIAAFSFAFVGCDSDSDDDSLGTIYDVAADNGFTTLLAAVDAAGLRATLESEGPFTVFAPTDAAFAALPAGTVESLLLPENISALTDILTYHVVPGRVTAAQVVELSSATTVQGQSVSIEVADGSVFINGAEVTIVDVPADNGIIHVIDAVLLPSS